MPAARDGVVVVHTVDGKLFGLESTNGNERWRYERQVPTLTLRGSGSPILSGGAVVVGMAAVTVYGNWLRNYGPQDFDHVDVQSIAPDGKHYRRVVPSPRPQRIIEIEARMPAQRLPNDRRLLLQKALACRFPFARIEIAAQEGAVACIDSGQPCQGLLQRCTAHES